MNRKLATVGIMLLLICTGSIPLAAQDFGQQPSSSRGVWLYVGGSGPGNYSRIQDAIDDATDGDTVFVYPGVYFETLCIPKTISLYGQNKDTTIIDGNGTGIDINITADHVNVSGFTIQDSDIENKSGGLLIGANDVTIMNNIISNNTYGIRLNYIYENEMNLPKDPYAFRPNDLQHTTQKNHTRIINNTITNNGIGVILFAESCNTTLTSNRFLYNIVGVWIFSDSNNNSLFNNTFVHDGLHVSNESTSNLVENNTVNGKPLLYLEGQSDMTLPSGLGQIILVRSSRITIIDQEITNTCCGVELLDTSHCQVTQNIFSSNNLMGLFLYNSNMNNITDNIIVANHVYGIELLGDNNTISGNTITSGQSGVSLSHSNRNTISNNNISNNEWGIHIEISVAYNLIVGNTIHSNTHTGIDMYYGNNNSIIQNSIINNSHEGIDIQRCEHILIKNNNISNHYTNIQLRESSYNYFFGNTITQAKPNGIYFINNCNHNIISEGNTFSKNEYGIYVLDSDFNTISQNDFNDNERSGIVFHSSGENIINENRITWSKTTGSERDGIWITGCRNFTITDNTIRNAYYGIEIEDMSLYNFVFRNHISQCEAAAIRIQVSSENHLLSNILLENTNGISIESTSRTTIVDNTITQNTNAGIESSTSSHELLSKNTISQNPYGIFIENGGSSTRIDDNIIEENLIAGIQLENEAKEITISHNFLIQNTLGINISGDSNFIDYNTIQNNEKGVNIWRSDHNTISRNNFLENKKQADFRLSIKEHNNTWYQNYWDQGRRLPQLIVGKLELRFLSFTIPWFSIDWNPAITRYI